MKWLSALWLSLQAPVAEPVPVYGPPRMCKQDCTISQAGYELIRRFEGYSPLPYKDVAGKLTIGVGHLILPHEKFDNPLLPHEADALLRADAADTQAGVNRRVVVKLKQNQFDALASFTFNLGEGNLKRSTLLARVNEQRHDDVPGELMKWVNAGGVRVEGLVRRRQEEGKVYAS